MVSRPAMLFQLFFTCAAFWAFPDMVGRAEDVEQLKVSQNGHFLVYANGRPFFYLGDTGWELFHRLNRDEADVYLKNRANKGFTVIQAVAIAEFDGLTIPNAYGSLPFETLDPLVPNDQGEGNGNYWKHVNYIVEKAQSLGLYVGLLPTWGRYWHDNLVGGKPLFNETNAEAYGEWIGKRYRDRAVIWILGGDRNCDRDELKAVIRAMARGLRKGDGGKHLITFHPSGSKDSSTWFTGEDWLDFNLRQNGHGTEFTGRYDQTRSDYDRVPVKPVIDGEPLYEGHPVAFNAKNLGHSIAADVRRPLYWDLFSGACGHTYGHHSVWQFWQPNREPINAPLMTWREALDEPGAGQMQWGRRLIESRPVLTRIPDDAIVVEERVTTAVPGAGRYRFVATRDQNGRFAMVYAPVGRAFKVRMSKISGPQVKAWWFDPRTGKAEAFGLFSNEGEKVFTPPNPGELLDWVLVLDDAAQNFPAPGEPLKQE